MSNDSSHDDNNNAGKWMYGLAWIAGLALLTFVFSDMLDRQNNPNREPESVRVADKTEVRLKQNKMGHYVTSGTINGVKVVFLVDTGATDVAIPAWLQDKLGLTTTGTSLVQTANGTVRVAETRLNSLTLGDIKLTNVRANLNPGMDDDEILLGMSVLKQLEFTQLGEWLILRTL